ncbi:unnamed protein product [Mytilus edulis]|uniref:3-beta hydroxysteroid dehydrogenase/isomerase domain-containing protein n=1 Tax=Mytilus edulis TaxID=6550 RepID=A0A8S3RAJ8_MYTED|nr:unnamed protein product [Mytilus edulis]
MHTVLVTGGCGFLGQYVVKHLQLYGKNIIRIIDFVTLERKLDTQNIIKACKIQGVQYLIYCGTLGSFYGYDAVCKGTETSVTFPKKYSHGHYGETKRKALEIVINENGSSYGISVTSPCDMVACFFALQVLEYFMCYIREDYTGFGENIP